MPEDGFPRYQRRDNGQCFRIRHPLFPDQHMLVDNRWVVPYNPYLCKRYQAHINVEVCGTVHAIKYIHGYVYKGVDRTTVQVANNNNEIGNYLSGRYIGPSEAVWQLFEYPMHEEDPPVQRLAVHLPNQQAVYFEEGASREKLAEQMQEARTTLMAYFA